jgi:hypothetical protein
MYSLILYSSLILVPKSKNVKYLWTEGGSSKLRSLLQPRPAIFNQLLRGTDGVSIDRSVSFSDADVVPKIKAIAVT